MTALRSALGEVARAVETTLDRLLPPPDGPEKRVVEAMRYACLSGGKRLRPFLVVAGAEIFGVPRAAALPAAAAVEMIHCYSLVHDDLPAMDDDELRRGRPTCHVAFDEATAILAGDGLLTRAFEALAAPETHADPEVRCALAKGLAAAGGAGGMVGGQMVDLLAGEGALDIAAITHLQALKTGALIRFACEAGAILGGADEDARARLVAYGRDLGLAFQIADDLLDVESTAAEMGKAVGKDAAAGKATFVALMGVESARAKAAALIDEACGALDPFAARAGLLRATARYVVERKH